MSSFFDFDDGRGLVPYSLHPNGGGKIAASAKVEDSVFVSAGCVVFGFAKIAGRVKINGRVRIGGDDYPNHVSTLIEDDVTISGSVQIYGCVLLRDYVDVRDNVVLQGCVRAMHRARICGNVHLDGWVSVMDRAYLGGDLKMIGTSEELSVRGESFLREGVITRDTELISAVRKGQLRQDGTLRKKAVKT